MTTEAVVYVVDDDASVRKALERLFRSAGLSVESFETAEAFLEHTHQEAPGCLTLDVQMPGLSGMELQEELSSRGIDLPIVFMTAHGDIPMSVRAMKRGAVDFLPKPVDHEELLQAVQHAIERHARSRSQDADVRAFRRRVESLTEREYEVLSLVVTGMLNKQIAHVLGISLVTVKVHRGRAMRKTGVDSVAEIARLWERAGLATSGGPRTPKV